MLDRANSGRAPDANILRAIRHAVAASACRAAWRASGDVRWERTSAEQSGLATGRLHQAAAACSSDAAKNISGDSCTPSALARSRSGA